MKVEWFIISLQFSTEQYGVFTQVEQKNINLIFEKPTNKKGSSFEKMVDLP